jgi:hypothetical protein
MDKVVYDAIISLGGNCSAASQLRMRGLRSVSLPFDWLAMTDASAVSYLADEFPNGLPSFFKRENLVHYECPHRNGTAPFHYEDSLSRFCFIHHFHKSLDAGGYEDVAAKMRRRIERMYRLIEDGSRILFVLATSFYLESVLVDRLVKSFRRRWPEKKIDFRIMQFGVDSLDGWSDKSLVNGFDVFRYRRPVGPYDLNLTSCEWSFLDTVSLRGTNRKFTLLDRTLYRIWKKISTHLSRKGYGCVGMRFS